MDLQQAVNVLVKLGKVTQAIEEPMDVEGFIFGIYDGEEVPVTFTTEAVRIVRQAKSIDVEAAAIQAAEAMQAEEDAERARQDAEEAADDPLAGEYWPA